MNKSKNLKTCMLLLAIIFIFVVSLVVSDNAQTINQVSERKNNIMINGVEFSVPNKFKLEKKQATKQLIYIPHDKYDLGLFVTTPNKTVDDKYIKQLAIQAAKYLFPVEKSNYSWKEIKKTFKFSKFEVGSARVQGFNGEQRVFVELRQIKIEGKEIIVGYVYGMGRGDEAKKLFEQNLGGGSGEGWDAHAHVIASITGEKVEDFNYGGVDKATPIKRNKLKL